MLVKTRIEEEALFLEKDRLPGEAGSAVLTPVVTMSTWSSLVLIDAAQSVIYVSAEITKNAKEIFKTSKIHERKIIGCQMAGFMYSIMWVEVSNSWCI